MARVSPGELGESVQVARAARPLRFPREAALALLVLAVAWQIASNFVPPFVIPGWQRIGKSLLTIQLDFVLVSLARVAAALVLSFAIGLGTAILMYRREAVERYAMPMVKLLMAVPAACWIIFAILWFKGLELRIAFVLVVICMPIFLIEFLDGMKAVSKDLRDMVRSFRPTGAQLFRKLILPAIVPVILTSWKINLSLAIRVVTFAELVGAVSGIGYGLVVAQELFSVADVFAWTVVLVIILAATQAIVSGVEKRLLRWRV